jgi:hypothetical protein
MLHEVYSRWIKGADKGMQRAAMEAAMDGISGAEIASKSSKIRQFLRG